MTLDEIKKLVGAGNYRYSSKVHDRLSEGEFDLEDLVHCVLSATEIYKKERDEKRESVHGMKYVIIGRDTYGRQFYTAGKVVTGAGGRYYFYITAHECGEEA